jgi:hypothetical protein
LHWRGQIALGLDGLAIGAVVITILRNVEQRMKQDREGTSIVVIAEGGPSEQEIRAPV